MARPTKEGIDYFPLDCQLDDKFELLEAEHGIKGFGVVVRLFQKIYGQNGYYIEWTSEVALLFARKNMVGVDAVSEIVGAAIRRGIFDKGMYEKYHILTSKGIQKRYLEATSRRKHSDIKSEYLLLKCTQNGINASKNGVNVNKNYRNADNNAQSKVKESKVNKSIRERKKSPTFIPPTPAEIEAYCKEVGAAFQGSYFCDYYNSRGWRVNGVLITDWKEKVRNWVSRDKEKGIAPKTGFHNFSQHDYDMDKLEEQLLKRHQ